MVKRKSVLYILIACLNRPIGLKDRWNSPSSDKKDCLDWMSFMNNAWFEFQDLSSLVCWKLVWKLFMVMRYQHLLRVLISFNLWLIILRNVQDLVPMIKKGRLELLIFVTKIFSLDQLKWRGATRDLTFMFWFIANDCACVVISLSNNAS